MATRTLLSILAAVSMLALTGPLPTPLHAAPSSDATATRLEAPPPQAATAPIGPLGPLALTQARVYTYSQASQVIFTDQRWAPTWVWSGVQISARVPAAAVDGPVVVETEHGDSNDSLPFDVGGSSAVPSESGEGTAWASTVSGQIASNTTWTQNVLVTGDVTVTRGVTLTIAPGVTVFFAAHSDDRASGSWTDKSELRVYGTLIAEGTLAAPIYFTSNADVKAAGDWGAIRIGLNSTTSSLANCVIRYGMIGVLFNAFNEGGGVISGTVRHSVMSRNATGLMLSDVNGTSSSTLTLNATIADNVIKDSTDEGIYIDASAWSGNSNNYAVVRNNVIEGNSTGVRVWCNSWFTGHADNYSQLLNNSIRNNVNYGVTVWNSGNGDGTGVDSDSSPTIENNLLDNNNHNLHLSQQQARSGGTQNYVHPVIRYNTIRNAAYGITISNTQPYGVISPTIAHNVFYSLGEGGSYAINNVTTRTITLGDNYWGSSPAEWDAGPQPGDTYGNVVVSSHLTSSSDPILTCVEPAAAQPGQAVTLYGANFWPPPPKLVLPILLQY